MTFFQELLALIEISPLAKLGLTWLDGILIFIFLVYAFEGIAAGFVASFFDLLSFLISFALALKFYGYFTAFITDNVSLPGGFAKAISFFLIALVSEVIINVLFRRILFLLLMRVIKTKKQGLSFNRFLETANSFLGFFPGVLSAFVLLSFLLTTIVSLPFSPYLKRLVSSSKVGNQLVIRTQVFERKLDDIFGPAVSDTINFLTVKPQSDEFLNLNFKTSSISIDEEAERQMFLMVNKERASRGIAPLIADRALRDLARAHSKDMFLRGYFSHYAPEGSSPFDRMAIANINYSYAGENLALAPNSELAMQGLMGSEGHRVNILSPHFSRIGVGAVDGGIYGEMFTQEFTD